MSIDEIETKFGIGNILYQFFVIAMGSTDFAQTSDVVDIYIMNLIVLSQETVAVYIDITLYFSL